MGFKTWSRNIKVFKQINTSIYMVHIQNMGKCFCGHDIEEHQDFEKIKR